MPAKRRSTDERATGANVSDDLYEEIDDEPFDEDEEEYEDEDEVETPRAKRSRALSAMSAGEFGQRHIAALTGRQSEGVTQVQPAEDGWLVQVEVVEDRRVPSSGDILALYEAEMDMEGNLLSYRRLRRYRRGRGDSSEAS
ncbi:gas vesicle protein GvpO [Streptosporangium sp. 'caverna']|uniref:gas vesicle protein GvpO n=1 Tax=Streptosporangium sp. 'caverna' TaxID=2202249 RepID=UPI000D7E7E3C|nr:gas vesicle protein GvpO [Streptosporangium sp. 'caverna']AWS40642.1 gas vesicle protein [Streptosporangium sp. 'caverna']